MVKKLVVEEFEVGDEQIEVAPKGYKYCHFKDPETGKYYRPKPTFKVEGENLEDLFIEIG